MARLTLRLCFLLIGTFSANLAWSKNLYMTIRRDFGPQENPQVEVNYVSPAPVSFRLLKPKDMAQFISSQIDLRRAWKQPKTELNSARFLLQGFNDLKLDTGWIRAGLNQDLKLAMKPQFGGASYGSTPSPLALGPKEFIAAPEGFEVLKEFSSVPEEQDNKKPFDVPGFDWWNMNSEGGLKTRIVTLPQLDPGFYVLQVLQLGLEGQVVLVINDIVARLEQTADAAVVTATNRNGEPLSGAKVSLRNIQGEWVAKETTDKNGVAHFKRLNSPQLIATVEKSGTAIIDTDFYATTAVSPDLYLYTDRPMFKSGETVHYRGILRETARGVSALTAASTAKVRVVDVDDGMVVSETPVKVGEFGTFHGEVAMPSDQEAGVYRIEAAVDDKSHIGEFRVKNYVKPIFFLTIQSDQETLKPGTQLRATIKVERFAGGVPTDVVYRAQLFRSKADSPQWVDDAGMGETGSLVTYFWDQTPNQYNPLTLLHSQDEVKLNRNGTGTINLTVPTDSTYQANFDYKYLLKITAQDADGNSADAAKSFLDMKSELMAQARMSASFAGAGFPATLKVRSVYPSGKAYPQARGQIQWSVTAYNGTETKIEDKTFKTDDQGRFEVAVPTNQPGAVRARVFIWDSKDVANRAEAELLVLGSDLRQGVVRVQEMSLLSRRDYFFPGETAKGLVMLPEGWGHNRQNKGLLYITVAGEKIFSQRVQPVEGLATWIEEKILPEFGTGVYLIVAYADPTHGWVERKFSYRIPQKDKYLQVKLAFAQGNVMPGQEQTVNLTVLDHEGKPLKSEVSLSVVDKAVLTLQPEFRPPLMEFFYPQAKLNLSSFFSSQFQSYGYGEPLAKLFRPNYWFSAAKAEPEKLKEEDTAHWVADLLTNDKGMASSTFRMPSNQTIWEVTAVAVDKNGRFGEGKSEFKSQMPISLILAMPAFLRTGDIMEPRLSIANTQETKQTYDVKYSLETPPELKVETPIATSGSVAPGKNLDFVGQATLVSHVGEPKNLSLTSHLEFAQKSLAFSHSLRAMESRIPIQETPTETDGAWRLSQSADAPIRSVRYTVTQGLMGTMMPAMRWLIAYPHGCVEQTLSRTIPSLVVRDLFESTSPGATSAATLAPSAGVLAKAWFWVKNLLSRFWNWLKSLFVGETVQVKLTRNFGKLVGDAKEFASAGLKKIAGFQNQNGSFAWFAGEGEGDLDMTLAVTMMLLSHERPYFSSEGIELDRTWSWLSNQYLDNNSERGVVMTFIESRLSKAGTIQTGRSDAIARINQIGPTLKDQGLGLQGLTLLAIDSFGLKDAAEIKTTQDSLLASLKSGLQDFFNKGGQIDLWRPLRAQWQGYPGLFVSDVALSARALQAFGALDNSLRASLVTLLLREFNGSHFGSTFETSMTLLHSAWLLKEDLSSKVSTHPPELEIDGKTVANDKIQALSNFGGWELEVDGSVLSPGEHVIKAERGDYLSADLQATRWVPIEKASLQAHGWALKKSIFKIENGGLQKRPFDPTLEGVRVGDLLYVELEFSHQRDQEGWRHSLSPSHFIVQDDIPSGFVVLESDKDYSAFAWYDPDKTKSRHVRRLEPDRAAWYFRYESNWMKQNRRVGYFMRATYGGTYSSGVARVEDFYDEASFAQTGGYRVRVAPHQR